MPNLAEPPAPRDPVAHHGVVVDPPAALGDPFTVRVPDFDDLHVFQIRRWEARGSTLPAVDDEVLVIVDDAAEPWAAAWWAAAGDKPGGGGNDLTEGVGMIAHGADGSVARPGNYFSYIWVGTAEPENAHELDQWIKPE